MGNLRILFLRLMHSMKQSTLTLMFQLQQCQHLRKGRVKYMEFHSRMKKTKSTSTTLMVGERITPQFILSAKTNKLLVCMAIKAAIDGSETLDSLSSRNSPPSEKFIN